VEFLTLSNISYAWQPILSITVVLSMVKELLSTDGRLDPESVRLGGKSSYEEHEAREAFSIALKTHGWE
jgi:hypothetical protein